MRKFLKHISNGTPRRAVFRLGLITLPTVTALLLFPPFILHAQETVGAPSAGLKVDTGLLAILTPAIVALLLPLLVFVTTASRMGAAQRERRLAAL